MILLIIAFLIGLGNGFYGALNDQYLTYYLAGWAMSYLIGVILRGAQIL